MDPKKIIVLPLMLLLCVGVYAGDGTRDDVENVSKWRFGADFQIKLAKGLKLELAPELRFNDAFDCLNLNAGVSYRTFGVIYWGANYRLVCDREVAGVVDSGFITRTEYEWEYLHRYAFDVTYKDNFGRFTPSFRLRYNNYTDDDNSDQGFLRYRAKLEYNIHKCKLTPSLYAELFHGLDVGMLSKMRYSAELDYKVNKQSSFSVGYKLDYFLLEYKNAHIFTLGYKLKL